MSSDRVEELLDYLDAFGQGIDKECQNITIAMHMDLSSSPKNHKAIGQQIGFMIFCRYVLDQIQQFKNMKDAIPEEILELITGPVAIRQFMDRAQTNFEQEEKLKIAKESAQETFPGINAELVEPHYERGLEIAKNWMETTIQDNENHSPEAPAPEPPKVN